MIHRALSFRFSLRCDEPLASALATALEPIEEHDESIGGVPTVIDVSKSGDVWLLESDGIRQTLPAAGRALAATLEHVNRCAASSLTHHVPLHAAAIRRPDGHGVVGLVGSSGAGKSTLGAAAVRRGWGFLAEEIAAVDTDTLDTLAFHRPVGLRTGGATALGIDYPVDSSGLYDEVYPWPTPAADRVASGRLEVLALIDRNAQVTSIDRLRPAEALSRLVEHSVVPDDDRVVAVFRQLDSLVRRIPVVQLSYTSLDEGVAHLERLAGLSS